MRTKVSKIIMTSNAAQILALLEMKSIIFGLAVFNFIFIWVKAERDGGIGGAVAPPWYNFWSFTNEPSRLLLAAALLWLSRKWSYALAAIVSGFIAGQLVYIFTIIEMTPLQDLKRMLASEDILAEWEMQHVFALIIFMAASFYLLRAIRQRLINRNGGVQRIKDCCRASLRAATTIRG